VPNPKEDDGGDDRADEAAVENAAGAEELEERPAFQEVVSTCPGSRRGARVSNPKSWTSVRS
jgi:hypothetical protein